MRQHTRRAFVSFISHNQILEDAWAKYLQLLSEGIKVPPALWHGDATSRVKMPSACDLAVLDCLRLESAVPAAEQLVGLLWGRV